ncbi:RNA/RNP complex-1-interacting phosphatase homolog [Drosophila takahashii]|uniref:RNA/RNP complex-1-interacting phosphatase homolog n=1 Tax=Drosophila takahashii TaxID=29030 RepID=UPI001CF90C10|nr:RNA/RNP complex-1-interacting phosphatase [Drosophila takahashii]
MAKAIPDRWLNYKPIGERVPGTRFIAFKVPLHQHVNARVEENLRLAPESLLESVPDLGLIIDLTNTNRYYHPSALTSHDVRHQKLMIPGKQTPPRQLSEKFCGFVADFLESNADNDKLIGVHCTHGVNRTGYLICYFMISVMKKSPDEAIKIFSAARGHEIERQNYLNSLKTLPNRRTNKERSASKESSVGVTEDYKDYESNSRHHYSKKYEDYRRQDGHYQRGGSYYQKSSYNHQNYGHADKSDWRSESSRSYSTDRYHSRDNRWNHQSFYKNSRDRSADWRNSGRNYPREDDSHEGGWSYSRNYRQDREHRQDRFQSNRSGGGYQQKTRGYQHNHYQNYQRDDSRRYSRRSYNDEG